MLAIGLQRAGQHPMAVAMELAEAADIDGPEVHWRFTAGDPFRQRPAGTAGARDAEGIESCADEIIRHFGRFAEDEIAIGGEGFRPVDEALDAGGLQRW